MQFSIKFNMKTQVKSFLQHKNKQNKIEIYINIVHELC